MMSYFNADHVLFRQTFRTFLDKEIMPHIEQWEEDGEVPDEVFQRFGDMGFFGMTQEEAYGGSSLDFWYDVIFIEEISKCESGGFGASLSAHPYLTLSHLKHEGSPFLKEKYLKKGISGEWHGALAITEPHAGSDVAGIKTTAVKDGDAYIINGSKCFITNGVSADYYIVACKTRPDAGASGISLIIVDTQSAGITKSPLKKLGWKASDTAEIAFDQVRVPADNLLGEENKGFYYIMQRFELERLTLALGAIASSEWALDYTLKYMNERKAFGRTINKFQALRHKIAQMYAELTAVKTFCYHICDVYSKGKYCVKEASMVKYLATELSDKIAYQCLQMFGGYGYMEEYKIARFFRDSRLGTIGGGTSEIMLEIIAKMVMDDVSYKLKDNSQPSLAEPNPLDSVAKIFATLPSRFKAEKAKDTNLQIVFKFDASTYLVKIQDGNLEIKDVGENELKIADCIVETDDATYIAVETGNMNQQEAFISGKIKVSDLSKMMQFGSLFRKLK